MRALILAVLLAVAVWPTQSSAQDVCTRQDGELYCRNADGSWSRNGAADQSTESQKPETEGGAAAQSDTRTVPGVASGDDETLGCTQTAEDRFECHTYLGHFTDCTRQHMPRGSPQVMTAQCIRLSDAISVLVDTRSGEIANDVRFDSDADGDNASGGDAGEIQAPSGPATLQERENASSPTIPQDDDANLIVVTLFMVAVAAAFACLFFLPTVISFRRKRGDRWSILVMNIFLGWTVIVWAILLAWSLSDANRAEA